MRGFAAGLLVVMAPFAAIGKSPKKKNVNELEESLGRFALHCSKTDENEWVYCGGRQGSSLHMGSMESLILFDALQRLYKATSDVNSPKVMDLQSRESFSTSYTIRDGEDQGAVKKVANYSTRWWQVMGNDGLFKAQVSLPGHSPEYLLAAHNSNGVPIAWIQCGEDPTWAVRDYFPKSCNLVVRKRKSGQILDDAGDMTKGSVAYIRDASEQAQWYKALQFFRDLELLDLIKMPGSFSRMIEDDKRLVLVTSSQIAVVSCMHPHRPNAECQVRVGAY